MKRKLAGLELGTPVAAGYTKARAKIEARIHLVVAELYNKYGFNEFTYSSIELSRKCGTRDYAQSLKDKFFMQTYRGNSISKKMSTYRIREEFFTPPVQEIAKDLFKKIPSELREQPTTFDEMRYVTFNLANIRQASSTEQFVQSDRFKLKQLERALLVYGVQEDPNNDNLVTLGIPHKQVGSRLYATWPFCLQCTSADLRQMTIYGDSIDLDAAAVQCMVDLGKKYEGKQEEIDVLITYIANKRQLRKDLATEFEVPEETIKCIFNIMVLGGHGSFAQVRANYRDTNSIARLVGDSIKASEIVQNNFIHAFYMAVKSLRRLIVDAVHETTETGWKITNSRGVTKTWEKKSYAKRHVKPVPKMMNWVYQSWELETMTANTGSVGDRGLPVHDSREGIAALEDVCNSFDSNNILYEVKENEHHKGNRFVFPDIPLATTHSSH